MRGRGDDDEEDEEAWIMNDMCVEILKHHRGETGIIYCFKKVTCDEVAALLRRRGIKAQAYHAGLSDKHRQTLQSAWIEGSIQILVATVAFGLGVDNPKVRFVFHHTLPKTLEGYYQESGRCGRDGLPAHAILYYSLKDYERLRYITDQTFSEAKLYMSKKGKKSLGKNGKKKARTSLAQAPHDSKKEEQEEGEGRAMKRGETNEENEEEEEKETHLHFLEQQYKRDVSALRTMRRFCESHACRRRYILNYFGEEVREDKKEKRDRERDSLECKKDEKDRLGQDRETTEREELSPLIKREKKCEEDEKQDGLNKREKPRPSIKSEDPKAQRCPQNLGAEGGVRKDQMKEENKQPDEDMASLKENNEEISSSSPLENQKMKSLASHSSSSSYRCCDICEREKMPERGLQFRGGRRERTATDGCAALLRHHAVGFYRTSVLSQDSLSMKKRHFRKGGGLTAVVDEDEGGVLVSGTLEIEKNDLGRLSSSPPSSSSEEDEEESSRLKRKRRGSSYGDSFMFERKKNSFSSSFLQGQRNLSHLASKRESKVVYHATPTMTSTVRYGGTGGVSSSSLSRALDGTEERRKEKGSEGEKNASQSIGKRLIAPQGGGESRRERGISDAIRAQGLSAVMRELERQEQEAEEREKEESSSSSAFFKKNRLYGLKQKFFGGAAASSSISSGTKERESSSSFYSLNEKRKAFPLQSNARKKEEGGGGGLSKERRLGLVKEERNSFRSSRDMSKEHQSGNSLSCGPSSSLFKTATRMPSSHGLSKTALLSSLPATKDERSSGNKQENGGFVRVRKGVGLQKKK
ncbi:atp-dependent dna family protein [Cystoisospora suis]|uniref:DNA 3'-5' helicase n=1 Tax=Cystoisospora suis TaxID=483139 RepID=A0A2C6L2E7_9APIC|nr:atp-dependent dna family protein [Cystoisospora suis]